MTIINFDMHRIGQTISRLRRERNMTQMQLADEMGVSFQAVSKWERGLLLPDTATLPDLAEILNTTVDALLAGGDCPPHYRRRMSVSRVREAIGRIQRLREILGTEHFMYRVMVDALDTRMNSSIEAAFSSEGAMDAYVCEALLACIDQGDYVDRDDIRSHIGNERAAASVLRQLDELGIK